MYSYLDKMQVGGPLARRTMQRGPDRPGPDPKLTAHDRDARDIGDVDAAPQLFSNRIQQHLPGGRDSTSDHDPVHPNQHHDIAGPDPKVAARIAERLLRPRV